MNDAERLKALLETLQKQSGLDAETYASIKRKLKRASQPPGLDEQGKTKVVFYDAKSYDMASFERQNSEQFNFKALDCALDSHTAELAKGFSVVCIFVNDCCDESTVKRLAEMGVKLIALRCAGYNNVNLDACQRYGIDVVRVPAYSPHAVAEHTIALIMMLNRKLHRAYIRNSTGQFLLEGLVGFDMFGKTVGVVGTGKIGRCLIDILGGFGCKVLAFDKYPDENVGNLAHVEYTDMLTLERESDIISLHTPLTPETHYLISEESIANMKDGAMIINTSRGALLDTKALIAGLKSGKIGSAGLDVYEEEADIFFHDISGEILSDDVFARLLTFNNVVITSHQAFLTDEALSNIAETTLLNINEFVAGKRGENLTNRVDSAC